MSLKRLFEFTFEDAASKLDAQLVLPEVMMALQDLSE